jgi:hypothetical protein
MAKQTSSKSSSTTTAKKKRPSEAPAPITKTLLKVDSVAVMKDVMVGTEPPAGDKLNPTHEQIAQRAFELYQQRGHDGGALTDWLSAERELRT